MLYEFEDEETGALVEVDFPIGEAPSIGVVAEMGGRRLRRLPSVGRKPHVRNWHVEAQSLPPWSPGAEGYTAEGVPLFSSERAIDAFCDESARQAEKDPSKEAFRYDKTGGCAWVEDARRSRGEVGEY